MFHEKIDQLQVSQDVKYILEELVTRKRKTDRLQSMRFQLGILNGFITIVLLFWIYKMNQIASPNMFELIGYFSSSTASMVFIFVSISLFTYSRYVSKEYTKQKQKYDNLREEIQLKLYTSWKHSDSSKLRDEISQVVMELAKVNIRFSK